MIILLDARDIAGLWSTHVGSTRTQGVFQVFRRRLSTGDSIAFADFLPIRLRALFVTDWNIDEEKKSFESREAITREVTLLREYHSFAPDTAIRDVAEDLRRQLDEVTFDELLAQLSAGAVEFWRPSLCKKVPAVRQLPRGI